MKSTHQYSIDPMPVRPDENCKTFNAVDFLINHFRTKFKEGVRKLWAADEINRIWLNEAEKRKKDKADDLIQEDLGFIMGLDKASVSRGMNHGEWSLDAMLVYLNNGDTPFSQLHPLRSKTTQSIVGWWLAIRDLKNMEAKLAEKIKAMKQKKVQIEGDEITVHHFVLGNKAVDYPLLPEPLTLPEFYKFWLLVPILDEWIKTTNDPTCRKKLAVNLWETGLKELGVKVDKAVNVPGLVSDFEAAQRKALQAYRNELPFVHLFRWLKSDWDEKRKINNVNV